MASGPSAPQVTVAVSGASQVAIGTQVQYTAAIAGTANTAVTWSVAGTSTTENYGTISPDGLYTPPAAVPVHTSIRIVATSVADTTKSSSTAAVLSNPVPSISSATLTPAVGSSFVVDVRGSNFMPSSAVIYGGYGQPTTYVSAAELKFTMTNPPPAGTMATMSVVTPAPGRTQSASYSVAVPSTVAVAVAGGGPIAAVGTQPMQFTATVTGSANASVTWSIKGSSTTENYGTISSTGLYTPPATVPVHTGILIVATSTVDTTKSAAAGVTIQQPTPAITGATLTPSAKGSYLVDVIGSGFVPSSSAVPGPYGVPTTYMSATHLQFTLTNAPALGSSVNLSVINPAPGRTQSASYNLVISTAVAVALTGPATALIGQPAQYTATVSGVANTAVTWTMQAGAGVNYGSISATGLYTPPPSVPAVTQFTLVATSVADTTKSASQLITLSNPVPVITSATLTPGSHSSFLVDVYGSSFLPSSQAQYLGYGAGTTYLSATHLQFTISNAPPAGTVEPISVITPAPGRTQSAIYNMTIPAAVAVTVAGAPVTTIGTPAQYTATVTGTPNTAVTWTISGVSTAENYGTIASNGLYTPPVSVPVHNSIALVATSTVDTTKSSAVNVTIQQPVPAITGAALTLNTNGSYLVDVFGNNFAPTSSAVPGSYGVPTTYISATHLQFTLSNPPVAGSSVPLSVINPAPGRTQSASYNLVISTAVSVSLTGPSTALIGTPTQYTATVSGVANTAVTWTMQAGAGVNYGSISSTGLYTPPPSVPGVTNFTLVATSVADTTKRASLGITLSNPVPVITSATLTPGYHSSFLVDVYGTGFLPTSQAQYLGYGAGSTYLSGTHLQFTISNAPPAGTVEPISVITPAPGRTQSAIYNMTIPAAVAVTVAGAAVTTIGTPAQYTATVTGTPNTAVTWSITGPSTAENYGTVASNGLYTPPASVPAHNYFTLIATSTEDTTKSASLPVTIMNQVPAIASATSTTVSGGAVSIDVKGVNFLPTTSVWFSGYGLVTTYVSATELKAFMPYTTVAAQTAGAPITIWTVTPNPGRVQSANFSVDMPGQVVVKVTGSNMVAVGTPSQYVAAVMGTTNTAVTWSVKAAAGVDPGTISATGLYTPPASIAANTPVTIVATSVAEPSSNGTSTATLVSVPVTAAARLLDQSTFGPTDSLIEHVQTIGLNNYVNEQLALPATLMPLTNAFTLSCGSNPAVCLDEDYWADIVTAPDQLRQRVAMALQEMLVISYEDANPAMVAAYSNMLTQDAFANWSQIMKDMTLSPGMGMFLNMANSGKPAAGAIANENFARENMQLFNIGLDLLNQDGTLQTDSSGNPIPAYTETQVEAFSRVFTGWTYAPASGAPIFPNYNTFNPYLPMVAFEQWHDTSSKVLLNSTLPAGQTAEQDLADAIQDVFNHPNVGPFVTQQLIQHLVKSNPSPAYVGRISAVFANDGTGVRGNMAAVIKAILLDPEARAGDTQTVENDGLLREPILWTAGVLRGLNAVPKPTVTDNSAYTAIDSWTAGMQEPVFYSPTVFNYYPASYDLGTTGLQAPQFALETTATVMTKLTLASSAVDNLLGKLMVDLSATGPLGTLAIASNDLLLDELNKVFLHGTMSAQMRSTIEGALLGISDPAQRVRTAVYLIITSSQYKVIH